MKLLRMKLQNYLSFKDEEIVFGDKPSLYLITGRNDETVDEEDNNGSGKTAFISAPRFAIWGKQRGQFSKDLNLEDIIHKNENDEIAGKCIVEVDCDVGGTIYRITRTVATTGQSLELYSSVDGNEWACLTLKAGISRQTGKRESGITRTQERINTVFMCDDNLFSNSAYFEQANIDVFARGSLTEKDNVFKSAIGLSKWGDYALLMKDDLSKLTGDEKIKEALLADVGDIEKLKSAIADAKDCSQNIRVSIKEVESNIAKLTAKLSNARKTVSKLELKYNISKKKFEVHEENLQERIPRLRKLENYAYELENKIKKASDTISLKKSKLSEIKSFGVDLNHMLEDIKLPDKDLDFYTDKYEKLKKKQVELATRRLILRERIDGISEATLCPLGIECNSLKEDEKEKLVSGINDQIAVLEDSDAKINELYMAVLKQIELYREYNHIKTKIQNARTEYRTIVSELKLMTDTRRDDNAQLESTKEDIEILKSKISEDKEAMTGRDKLEDTANRIKGLNILVGETEMAIENSKNDYSILNEELRDSEVGMSVMADKLSKYSKVEGELIQLQDRKKVIKEAIFVTSKDIPHILISQAIPEIQYHIRDFVYELSGGRIDTEFRMVKELKSKVAGSSNEVNAFDPWVCIDGRWLKYQQTSGGERARVDVAIHLGWVCFMVSRSNIKIETLFLDEVGAALDKNGIEKLVELLKQIMETYSINKIFYVTQSPDVKKLIDDRIQITRTSSGSKVVFA